jgi:hypothetical protein
MNARWISTSAWALCLVLVALSVPLFVANRSVDNEIEPYLANLVIAALSFSTVGVLVASRRRENPIGWLLLGTGILYAIEIFTGNYGTYALFTDPGSLPGGSVAAWLTSWVWICGGSLILFVFLFFPDGRLPSPRWRPVAWLVLISHRLFDIDLLINRALVYGSLTATLALLYVGVVVSLQTVFHALAGSDSQLAVVASTLVIAALFNPLRRRIQDFIDRRFYRRKYDAARTLEAYAAGLRKETDLEQLSGDLISVIEKTVQPEHVSLWVRAPDRGVRR